MNILKKTCLILCLNCFALVSFGQITLEHTFTSSTFTMADFEYISEPTELFYSSTDNQVKLYNSNYSLYKTINLNLPSGYSLGNVISMGRHIINTDDKVDFFVTASSTNAMIDNNQNNDYTLLLINEDGQVISNFGYSYSFGISGAYIIGNQLKLHIVKYLYENNTLTYQSLIYSCSGNYSPDQTISYSNNSKLNPFPNPTMSRINLPYKLDNGKTSTIRVFNLNGQLMDAFNIGSDFEYISIDVSNYAKGIYVYEYDGISNKFVVQ